MVDLDIIYSTFRETFDNNEANLLFISLFLFSLNIAQSVGAIQKEAIYINKSLSFLEQTVIALAEKQKEYVPFRQTKLTHMLKDAIGGNCNTLMIANVWGEAEQIYETVS